MAVYPSDDQESSMDSMPSMEDKNQLPQTEEQPMDEDTPEADAKEEAQTFLVEGSNFGGKMPNPGDKCTFEVVACHGDECELRYVEDKGDDEKPMDGAMNRLKMMAK